MSSNIWANGLVATDARGVSVTQLDSIDPTLVVYRAEATFVGLGLLDLYSALVSPGARVFWDKQYDDATLLEDVNELTELWHFKTKPAWPVVYVVSALPSEFTLLTPCKRPGYRVAQDCLQVPHNHTRLFLLRR